jgi:hypothetical protein
MGRVGHSTTRAALIYQHRTAERDRLIAAASSGIIEAEPAEPDSSSARSGHVKTTTNLNGEFSRHDHGSDVRFLVGAGDGNRTRTISLGICPIAAVRTAELGIRVPTSDRDYLSFTGVNGTLMAW